jgi:hypothetical protein
MSERDGGGLLIWLLLVGAFIFFVYALSYRLTTNYNEIRDLQRRVAVLEGERR